MLSQRSQVVRTLPIRAIIYKPPVRVLTSLLVLQLIHLVSNSILVNCRQRLILMDYLGNIYIADAVNNRVRKVIASTSIIITIAGTGAEGYSGDGGQATSASTQYPHGVNLDRVGNVYFGVGNSYNGVRKITVSTGVITTVTGIGSASGGYNGDNIQATAATFNDPVDVVLDHSGNLYICDKSNHRVRKVDVSTGLVTTVIGTGAASSTGDGSYSTSATVNAPHFSRFDSAGNFYISEFGGNRIRKISQLVDATPSNAPTQYPTLAPSSSSIISTFAGNGNTDDYGDGLAATAASFSNPAGVVVDSNNNVYFNDMWHYKLRKISSATGIITTYAGTGGYCCAGAGGLATSATLDTPNGLAIDSSGIHISLLRLLVIRIILN